MDFEKQKPVTDGYREGFVRTFHVPQKTERYLSVLEIGEDGSSTLVTTVYSNGCPILSENENA